MSDRGSAGIYQSIFSKLGSDPTSQHMKWARQLWKESLEFDFHPRDMEIEEALEKLGLARKMANKDHPDEGEVWQYGPKGDDQP